MKRRLPQGLPAAHAAARLGPLPPPLLLPPVAIKCTALGRLAMMRSSHRLHTRLKKWDSSALVVAWGGVGWGGGGREDGMGWVGGWLRGGRAQAVGGRRPARLYHSS